LGIIEESGKIMSKKARSEISSRGVYADIGFENHEEMATKAKLVMEISSAIKKKKITQTAAAKILGLAQPKLSELLRGRFRGYSVERLIHFLNELGKDVDIVVKAKPASRKARVSVYHSNSEGSFNTPMAAKGKN
jgi:predicted XRE-type DNA-binding protein